MRGGEGGAVREAVKTISHLRSKYDRHQQRQQQRRAASTAAPPPSAWASLELLDSHAGRTVTKKQVSAQYKKLVKVHHPDVGGDVEKFRQIKDAYEKVKRGGVVSATAVDYGDTGDGGDGDVPDAGTRHRGVRSAYASFWAQRKRESEARNVDPTRPSREALLAYVKRQQGQDEPFAASAEDKGFRGFMRSMSSYDRRAGAVRPGTVLVSRMHPSAHFGVEWADELRPPSADELQDADPVAVYVYENTRGAAVGVFLNRGEHGGPCAMSMPVLHADSAASGRRRTGRGVYMGGTLSPSSTAGRVARRGHVSWKAFELEREVNLGLWAVRQAAGPTVLFAEDVAAAVREMEAPPVCREEDDATEEELLVLQGLLEHDVVSSNPWR